MTQNVIMRVGNVGADTDGGCTVERWNGERSNTGPAVHNQLTGWGYKNKIVKVEVRSETACVWGRVRKHGMFVGQRVGRQRKGPRKAFNPYVFPQNREKEKGERARGEEGGNENPAARTSVASSNKALNLWTCIARLLSVHRYKSTVETVGLNTASASAAECGIS